MKTKKKKERKHILWIPSIVQWYERDSTFTNFLCVYKSGCESKLKISDPKYVAPRTNIVNEYGALEGV